MFMISGTLSNPRSVPVNQLDKSKILQRQRIIRTTTVITTTTITRHKQRIRSLNPYLNPTLHFSFLAP